MLDKINIKNIFFFSSAKYIAYLGLFLRGIMIAKFLGPEFLGVWGILMLIMQYLSYSNLGIQYALTKQLSEYETDDVFNKHKYFSNIFALTGIISCLIILIIFLSSLFVPYIATFLEKNSLIWLVVIYAILNNFQQLYINYYRDESKYFIIAISEIFFAFFPLFVLFFSDGVTLMFFILLSFISVKYLSLSLFSIYSGIKLKIKLDRKSFKKIISKSLPLLLYNLSFYMISISAKTIVGLLNDQIAMGYYHLTANISNAVLLGINTISWILFPKLLKKFNSNIDKKETIELIINTTNNYNSVVTITFLFIIIISPAIYFILPEYNESIQILLLFLIAQAFLSHLFVFSSYLIARDRIIQLSIITAFAVSIVWFLSQYFLSRNYGINCVAFSTVIAAFILHLTVTIYCELKLYKKITLKLIKVFYKFDVILLLFLFVVLINYQVYLLIIIFLLFLVINQKQFFTVFYTIKNKA